MRTLTSLSGGIDSAYVLHDLLTNTQDEVTALFIDMRNADPIFSNQYDLRSYGAPTGLQSELDNAEKVVTWLKANVRDFTFIVQPINSAYLSAAFNKPNNPAAYVATYGAEQCNNNLIDKVVISHEKENDGYSNGGTVNVRRTGAWAAYDAFVANASRGTMTFPLISSNYNQAVALTTLPQVLIDATVPPDVNSFKYAKRQWFVSQLASGKNVDEITTIIQSNSYLDNGKFFSMKYWINGTLPTDANTWVLPTWPNPFQSTAP